MSDFAAARRMMVDGQVRPSDVTDLRIIDAMMQVPRETFVQAPDSALAYLDLDAPVGGGRALLKPMVLSKLLQAADISGSDHVLDVGCATGYSSAVLSQLAGSVVALEEDEALAGQARERLAALPNVTVTTGTLALGWSAGGPYDVIFVNGATEIAPTDALCHQLKEGGRLVCVLGRAPNGRAMLYRSSRGEASGRPIFDAAAPLLPGFAKHPVFAF